MSEEITIPVTSLHADLHEQLLNGVNDYDDMIRNNTEEFIHDIYREAERAREEQSLMSAQVEETVEHGDN